MTLENLVRLIALIEVGVMAFMLLLVVGVSSKVLRGRTGVGFLLWHIITVSVGISLITAVGFDNVYARIGTDLTWRTLALLVGVGLLDAALVIIFQVESQRARLKKSRQGVTDERA